MDSLIDSAETPPRSSGHSLPAAAEPGLLRDARGGTLRLTRQEGERLLSIISQASRVRRHVELFQLLQGEVQALVPHQILVCAWGDFAAADFQLDVISAIPGVRTRRLAGCRSIAGTIRKLHQRWLAGERQPVLLDGARVDALERRSCDCALHASLRAMRSILVHGVHDARDGSDILYLAAHADSIDAGGEAGRFGLLADAVLAQIDAAFRKVSASTFTGGPQPDAPSLEPLSAREEEILGLVSEGWTNARIARILSISSFTVKNHVQRIIRKLGAANRTEAASKHRRMNSLQSRRSNTTRRGAEAATAVAAGE